MICTRIMQRLLRNGRQKVGTIIQNQHLKHPTLTFSYLIENTPPICVVALQEVYITYLLPLLVIGNSIVSTSINFGGMILPLEQTST